MQYRHSLMKAKTIVTPHSNNGTDRVILIGVHSFDK